MDFLVFQPIYQERVWGGRGLETSLGRKLPADKVIGESWEIVDRPEANSTVGDGALAGKSLAEVRAQAGAQLLGPSWPAEKPFPILVKWLDCEDRLSLQVHPPAAIAAELGGEPKTENWYIAECKEGASLIAGLTPGVTRAQFEDALRANELEPLVWKMKVQAGDSLFVESGRIHAIDAGNLILEIQQNSDTTYRVYDWGRVGLDGKPRQLHVEESLRSIDFDDFAPEVTSTAGVEGEVVLADSPVFRLRKLTLASGAELVFEAHEEPRILSVVEGSLSDSMSGRSIGRGSNALLPYDGGFRFQATESTVVLVTDHFVG
jgi:mannose-6-phosphate isomerase